MRRLAVEMIAVYAAWFLANLGANLVQALPGRELLGSLLYYVAVASTGVLVPWWLARRRGFDLRWWPGPPGAARVTGGLVLITVFVFLGTMALADQGLPASHLVRGAPSQTLQPLAYLSLSMVAYLVLFWTYLRHAARRLAAGRWGRVVAIVLPALAYGVYHFASVDSVGSMQALIDEVAITTVIGLLPGTYVELTDDLVLAWVAINVINLFAFAADPQFHAGWGDGLVAVAFLALTLAVAFSIRRWPGRRPA